METTPAKELADRLAALGQAELDEINTFLDSVSGFECGALLVEACRCLDHAHVIQLMSAHVALETADAAALHARVSDVADMIALSKATMRNIYQNITVALGLKVVFLVTTIIGVTGLWPAILADTGATVLVTLNAIRLLRWRPV